MTRRGDAACYPALVRSPGRPLLLLAACLAAPLAGCWSGGPRRPLFGGPSGEISAPTPLAPPPPPRPHKATAADELLARLQRGNAEERATALEELVLRGQEARETVATARDEALVLHALLDAALVRIDAEAGPSPSQRLAADLPWLEEQHRLAVERFGRGDVWGALRLIDALLVVAPDSPVATRLQALRRRAAARLLQESVCRVELVPSAGGLTPDHPLGVRLRLVNQGQETVELTAGEEGELGVLSLVYEELAPAGGRTRTMQERTILSPDEEIELDPGESWELNLQLLSPHKQMQPGVVGRYQLGGRLRARSLVMGDTSYSLFVPFLPAEVIVVESRDKDLLEPPASQRFLGALQAAFAAPPETRGETARRVFVAAMVLAAVDRDGAVAALAEALTAAQGALSDALCAALGRATGEPLPRTREEWLRWWASERQSRPERRE